MEREELQKSKRVVVKVGSSLLDPETEGVLPDITRQIHELIDSKRRVVLVTSGAIYFGLQSLRNKIGQAVTLPQKQATAAVGQPKLMNHYQRLFEPYDIETAQVLLTQEGIHNRQTYLNASNTLNTLLEMDVLPIVNENDTVATEEIQFGDNDTLSVLVTTLVDADLLINLSDVRGLYREGPSRDRDPIRTVEEITDEIRDLAGPTREERPSVGGMTTKIQAAETITQSGTPMVIASGRVQDVLLRILRGDTVGTFFQPRRGTSAVRGRKRWIGYHLLPKGYVKVDEGAVSALKSGGKSLLPSGVLEADGRFERGDAVKILDPQGEEFARGLVNYNLRETNDLKGCHTSEISDILGSHDYDEIIHRDNMVIFPDEKNQS